MLQPLRKEAGGRGLSFEISRVRACAQHLFARVAAPYTASARPPDNHSLEQILSQEPAGHHRVLGRGRSFDTGHEFVSEARARAGPIVELPILSLSLFRIKH